MFYYQANEFGKVISLVNSSIAPDCLYQRGYEEPQDLIGRYVDLLTWEVLPQIDIEVIS